MRDNQLDGSALKPRAPHPDKALSAAKVRHVTEPGRYADGNGLYLIVDPSGAKRWVLRTVVQGKRRDIGLGGLSVVPLAEARERAASMRKLARDGADPIAERRKAQVIVPTFEEAATKVHKEYSANWKNEKHVDQWINTLKEYAFPFFGNYRVDRIGTAEVMRALSPIWLKKPETARRVRQRIGTVLDWAKAAGYRTGDNPIGGIIKGLPKQTDGEDHHAALPYVDAPSFIQDLWKSDATEIAKLAFEFLILTAARTGEVVAAKWPEIDKESQTWTIPAERMKAGREHRIPLSPRCLEILSRAEQLSGKDTYIFPGRKKGAPLSNMAFLMILRRMGRDITAHGFRSSFRDWAAETTNFPREVCEMALAHVVKDKVEAAYRRGDLFDKRRQLMKEWENYAIRAIGDDVSDESE